MCELLGLWGYNRAFAAEQVHMKILSSTYLEVYEPAQFPRRSTERPLEYHTVEFKNKIKSRDKRTTPG
jgi:hypothetical protein